MSLDRFDMPRDLLLYLTDIVEAAVKLKSLFENKADSAEVRELACLHLLQILGEAAKKVPKDLREQAPTVPWRQMCGLRDVIVHEYFHVDFSQLQSLRNDLPTIIDEVSRLIDKSKLP